MRKERPVEARAPRGWRVLRVIRWTCRACAGVLAAPAAAVLGAAAVLVVVAAALFSVGCAFTERIVDRKLLNAPEMRFDYLDPDRDIDDIVGIVAGGGGGGGGGC